MPHSLGRFPFESFYCIYFSSLKYLKRRDKRYKVITLTSVRFRCCWVGQPQRGKTALHCFEFEERDVQYYTLVLRIDYFDVRTAKCNRASSIGLRRSHPHNTLITMMKSEQREP